MSAIMPKTPENPALVVTGPVAENRRARFDYEILDTLEAGIMLTGTEVKSLRNGKAQITESYASPEKGGLWLINAHIPEYLQANRFNHEERRPRKLLVSKKQLAKLSADVERAGNTIVPLKLYFNERGMAKLLIGVGKGKKASTSARLKRSATGTARRPGCSSRTRWRARPRRLHRGDRERGKCGLEALTGKGAATPIRRRSLCILRSRACTCIIASIGESPGANGRPSPARRICA